MPKHAKPAAQTSQQPAATPAPRPQPPVAASARPAKKRSRALTVVAVIVLVALLLAAAGVAILILRPPFAESVLNALGFAPANSTQVASGDFSNVDDTAPSAAEQAALDQLAQDKARTPIIAQCQGIDLHSPIAMADLTGILFHQASTGWALVMTTQLPEADYDTVADSRTMRINRDQQGEPGSWADTEALHLWRSTDGTEMDTSIDVGAAAGTTVVSPVDGTVILIRDYKLYDEIDDIEIHIQPASHPDLDVVLIHTSDPLVKAGDKVEAGITPLSHVRDIEADLTDVQLGFFTPEGVGGNHTHVQVNDKAYEDYAESRLEGAIEVKER